MISLPWRVGQGDQHRVLGLARLAEAVGLSESAVSHHVRALRQMRLARARKEGRQVFYSLDAHVADLFQSGLDHVQHG